MIAGVRNKRKFFEGCELETILVIDKHEEIPDEVTAMLDAMLGNREITKLVIERFDHSRHRWNDHLYVSTMRHATFDYIAHFDGDAAAFRRPEYPMIEGLLAALASGYSYVCQQTPLTPEQHGMWWASTRFLFCKRETMDLDEIERAIDDRYRKAKYGTARWCPCFEHLAALVAPEPVLYPKSNDDNFVFLNFVHYHRGVLAALNAMPSYDEQKRYIFETCGGLAGASDFIAKPL